MMQQATLIPRVGGGAIHVNIPRWRTPPAVLIWGEVGREHTYVLTGGLPDPAGPLVYHEMTCARLDDGLLDGVREAAAIAERIAS